MPKLSLADSANLSIQSNSLDRDAAAWLNPFVGMTCRGDMAANLRGGVEFLVRVADGVSSRAAYGLDMTLQAMANALAFETEGGAK